jgi:conjugal transfer mating pair stabilization protein TraG
MYDLIDGTVDPGHVLRLGRRLGADGDAEPGALHDPDRRRRRVTVDTCPNVYTNLNGRLPAQITRIQGGSPSS